MRSGALSSSKRSSNTLAEKRIKEGENKRSSNTLAERRIEGGENVADKVSGRMKDSRTCNARRCFWRTNINQINVRLLVETCTQLISKRCINRPNSLVTIALWGPNSIISVSKTGTTVV